MPSANVRWHQPTFRQSMRTRLLVLFSGLIVISVLAIGYLGVNSVQTVGERAQRISAQALRTQAEEYLRRVTVGDTQRHDLILREVEHNAENVARHASGIFAQPEAFAGEAYWRASDHMSTGPDGQYANDETDVSSVFIPNFVDIDQELLADLELGAYLEFALIPTYDSDPNTVAIYLGTEHETTRYYPNVNLGDVLPPDFQVTQRPWYVSAAPESNPGRAVVWSPVYIDATGQGLMVTAAAPVYIDQDEFIGVIGLDVTLKDISASVEANRLLGSGYSFLVGNTGQAIALPEQGYQDILGRPPKADEFGTDLSAAKTEWDPVLGSMMVGSTGFGTVETGGRELFVAYAPLESTGWSLANVVEADEVLQAMATLQEDLDTSVRSLTLLRILPVGGGIFVVMAAVGLLLTDRLAAPVRRMAAAAQRIGSGQWDVPLPEARNDEIGVLSQAFATMAVQLRALMEGLEQQVDERTRALQEANRILQRRAIQLQASTEVGRAITSIFDVDELLAQTVELIRDRFGFYHAGIFLLDETGEWAVLREATGEAGAQMKARGHRLAMGDTSMVGWTVLHRQPRIALYAEADAVRFPNPLLPYTRSEMTLPLMVGERLLGVLNVQSTEVAAFEEDDVRTLQSMANQVAVAIENARRVSDEALLLEATSPIYRASRRLAQATTIDEVADSIIASVRETGADGCTVVEFEFSPAGEPEALLYRGVWRRDREPQFRRGMRLPITQSPFPLDLVSTLWSAADVERAEHLPQSARRVFEQTDVRAAANIPLRARERVVGQVVVLRSTPGPFSDSALRLYEALSNQAAVALERGQLLEEAQQRADRELLARKMIDRIRRAMDIEQALQTTAEELSQAMGVGHVSIELSLEAPAYEGRNSLPGGAHCREIPHGKRNKEVVGVMNAQAASEWNLEIQRRRTVLLDHLLLTAIVGGVVAMVSLYIAMPPAMSVMERLVEMAPFLAGWLVTLIARAWRGLGYRPRALILLSLTYVLGIVIFARGGLPGSGRVWLLLLPALTPVLLGPRWGIAAGAISGLTYVFFTVAISQEWVAPQVQEDLTALAPLLSEGGAFLLVAVILTLILWSFSRSWLQALAGADAANRRLQAQARELAETNERLRRQTSQLQATAEIARAGSSTLDPDKLLEEAVRRIQSEFGPMGVHCVGLFLLDETQRSAVLRAASGEAGQSLLGIGYAVELDETSTVGRCITYRQACTALDVEEEKATPETLTMPRACSEIALPLRSRGRILGALSVQSTQEATLSEADIAVLQAIADQVAVAIDNAVLFSQTEAALEELQAVQRLYQAQAWHEFLSTKPAAQVDYTHPGAQPGDEAFLREVRRAARVHGRTVATSRPPQDTDGRDTAPQAALGVPLKLWGQVIGTVALHATDGQRRWTADDIALAEAVAEQATLTVENLRLMDETQRRAARERLTREITDRMRRATSVEDIVQTAVDGLFDALEASRTFVRLGPAPPAQEDGEVDRKPEIPTRITS